MVYHQTGVRDDPPEIRGASFLYQNLMSQSTEHLDQYDYNSNIRQVGGLCERIVNYDYSVFYEVLPENEISTALWMESERLNSLKLSDKIIDNEKYNIYQRNSKSQYLPPDIRAAEWVTAKVFEGTLYEIPIYGKITDIRTFNNRSIMDLYSNFKNLSKITMVIAGKFDLAEVEKTIYKYFNSIPASPQTPSRNPTLPPVPPTRNKYVYQNQIEENLDQPFVFYGFRSPARTSFDYIYFEFIRYYLLDERLSELDKELNRVYNLNITIDYDYTDYYDANALRIKFSARERGNLEKAKVIINKKLDRMVKGNSNFISGADLKKVKVLMEIDFLKNMTILEKRSLFLAESLALFKQKDLSKAEDEYVERIRKISSYDIVRIARKYLAKDNRVIYNVVSNK